MKKFTKIILAMIMALQFALPQAVLADTATNLLYDFTTDPLTSFGTGYSTKAYVQGQSGKTADDTSLKMSIVADQASGTYDNVGTQAYIDDVLCPNWSIGKYMHYSMEFLPKNKDSYISVAFGIYDSAADNDKAWKNEDNVFLNGSDNSEGFISVMGAGRFTPRYNAWNKVDVYIEKETGKIFVFNNEVYAATGQMNNSFILPVKRIFNIKINQYAEMSNGVTKASDVYFDNIMLETTDEMPQPNVIMHNFESDWNVVENTLELGTISYVDGVGGKAPDDTSVKFSTGGQNVIDKLGPNIMNEFGSTSFHDRTLPYIHFSMEFLQEDANSEIIVQLGRSVGDWGWENVITGTSANTITIAGTEVPKKLGEWNQVDIWFDAVSTDVVASVNGKIVTGKISTRLSFPYKMQVNQIVKYEGNTTKSSNVYFDNISFEAVDEIPTTPNPQIMMDFETDNQLTPYYIVPSYVKGQYAKGKNDTSIRLSTEKIDSGRTDGFIQNNFGEIPGKASNKYLHFSMEFMQEDAKSAMFVYLRNANKDEQGNSDKLALLARTSEGNPKTVYLANEQAYQEQNIGMWNKLDMYFETGTSNVTVFMNGTKYECTLPAGTYNNVLTDFELVRISQSMNKVEGAPVPSAIQFDNIYFERVAEIPEKQDWRPYGEIFDFDDISEINSNYDVTHLVAVANGTNVNKLPASGNPSVKFGQNWKLADWANPDGTSAHTIVSGALNQPSWNKSILSKFIKSDSQVENRTQGLHYNTSVKDLEPGEIGHLTFKVARIGDSGNPNVIVYAKAGTMVYEDGSTNNDLLNIFSLNWNGTTFFGQDAQMTIPRYHFAKIDIIYKVGENDTKIDGYVDGVKKVSDYILSNEEHLNYIGDIYFISNINKDYIVDDLAFGRFTKETMYDPTAGYTITTSDEALQSRIDNVNKIAVLKDYTVEDLSSKVNEVVKVYAEDGTEITSGTMSNADVIEVSNGFGGNTYFSVIDCVFEETFDGSVKNLSLATEIPAEEQKVEYVTGVGGKTADETNIQLGRKDGSEATKEFFIRGNVGPFAANTVTYEISARPMAGETEITFVPNGYSAAYDNRQHLVKFMPNGEIRVMGNDIILDEKWIQGQWYKVAAVMEKGADNIKIYLNGESVYDGEFTGLDNNFAGFESITHINICVLKGECGFDDLRVGYNAYDPTVDLVESKVEDVFVNNADSIIGFTDEIPVDVTADLLKEKVTYDTLTYENDKAFIRKGETIKYYTLGYKTKEFKRPVIDVDGANAIATAELKTTAKAEVNTQSVAILLAIYDTETNRLEKVVTDSIANSHNATEDLVATIENGVSSDKYAVAYMWDGVGTLSPLKTPSSLDFAELAE